MPSPASHAGDNRTNNPYVVLIGSSAIDITGTQQSTKPMRPKETVQGTIHYKQGGVARNAAENLARLGCDCRLISVFGDDHDGHALMTATRQTGVDLAHSIVLSDAATTTCLILNSHDGETFSMLVDRTTIERLTPEMLMAHCHLLDNAALIVTSTHLTEETLAWLFTHYADRPMLIDTVDAALADRVHPWLGKIHTLKTNRQEASLLSGQPFNAREDAPAVANWFLGAGVRQVVLSLGAHGLYYSNGEQADWMPPLLASEAVINVTGAGDALMAGLVYGQLQGLTFADSVAFGNACAGLTLATLDNNHPALTVAHVHTQLQRSQLAGATAATLAAAR